MKRLVRMTDHCSSRDFERADELRHELLEEGVEVTDLPGGQSTWRKLERR